MSHAELAPFLTEDEIAALTTTEQELVLGPLQAQIDQAKVATTHTGETIRAIAAEQSPSLAFEPLGSREALIDASLYDALSPARQQELDTEAVATVQARLATQATIFELNAYQKSADQATIASRVLHLIATPGGAVTLQEKAA